MGAGTLIPPSRFRSIFQLFLFLLRSSLGQQLYYLIKIYHYCSKWWMVNVTRFTVKAG